MFRYLNYIVRFIIFWLLLFFVHRLIFIFSQTAHYDCLDFSGILLCNWHSLGLDLSVISYFSAIVVLVLAAFNYNGKKVLRRIFFTFFSILIVITSLILVFDIGLFAEWGNKINSKALSYLAYPKEALGTVSPGSIILLLSLSLVLSLLSIWAFNKFVHKHLVQFKFHITLKIFLPILLLGVIFIGIRGGLQLYPINKSSAYFSKHSVLNQAAVNSVWNFLEVATKPDLIKENPYKYFEDEVANQILNETFETPRDSTTYLFNTPKPNIVMILLESWSAEVTGVYGNTDKVTPEFDKLSKEGYLFSNYYSTGFRTEQGFAALISGFPSQPTTTIIREFGKFDKLPSIARSLDSNGYHSSYYYGGDLYFANTESYMESAGFDKLIGQDDFEYKNRTHWGAYDEELFNFTVSDLKNNPKPFLSILMTSTNHEPFDFPVDMGFYKSNKYYNTVNYTDKCLGEFINKSKTEEWYKNTIFIIVADHAHYNPYGRKSHEVNRHWIPFLIYGEPLKDEYKGQICDIITCHSDFPATILSQLKIEHNNFHWSKNIFNKYSPEFAFYSFDDGFGWINPNQAIVYDHKLGDTIYVKNKNIPLKENELYLNQGKAYLQILMKEFIEFNN
ncbi:MAG: sulfatase-like hydrolase/transferase [Saprospiraceae bacterium]|nr:sulfatase-like hydrolase/transferase [Saprospiraceae bacterium]